jgi:hypothetical protein
VACVNPGAIPKTLETVFLKNIGKKFYKKFQVFSFFETVFFVNQVIVMIQRNFHSHIVIIIIPLNFIFNKKKQLPHLENFANELTGCEIEKNVFMRNLEEIIERGLEKSTKDKINKKSLFEIYFFFYPL